MIKIYYFIGERPYVCEKCSKSFNQKNALQVHLKKHSGDKPYQCPYCTSSFTQKGNLKIHIKRMHHKEMVDSMNLPSVGASNLLSVEQVEVGSVPPTDPSADISGVVTEFLLE